MNSSSQGRSVLKIDSLFDACPRFLKADMVFTMSHQALAGTETRADDSLPSRQVEFD
jgi:hypothetical protein